VLDPESGPFSRLNARRSSPAEVARDFVAPPTYNALVKERDPQILRGPRGIGKTTLLKMLLPEAIDAWQQPEAEQVRESIGFTGAFVAADRMWAGQLEGMSEALPGKHRPMFGRAAFALMSLAALAESADYRITDATCRRVELARTAEEALVAEIAPRWLAHPATASLGGLADQMHGLVADLGRLMQELAHPDATDERRGEVLSSKLLTIDFWSAATFFIHAFNRAVGQHHEPWILLIDEFEFLPRWTRVGLGESFQGKDPLLSFKLSIAPYTTPAPFAGSAFNDWSELELAPKRAQREKDQNVFAAQLMKRQIAERRPGDDETPDPEAVFPTGKGAHGEGDSYAPDSVNAEFIAALAGFDEGFRTWKDELLGERGLEDLKSRKKEYDEMRKAMPLVRLRLEYWKPGQDSEAAPRSRHAWPHYYAGAQNIYTISENNPRWLKALAHQLLAGYKPGRAVPPADQTRAVKAVSKVLYNNMRAVPIEEYVVAERTPAETERDESTYFELRPFGLITTLGKYMEKRTQGHDFTPEVPGTFLVDDPDPWLEDVVNSLVFLGALVVEGRDKENRAQVRPAHMWAPIFRLLLRKGRQRSLRSVLQSNRKTWRRKPRHGARQERFAFGGEE